MRAPCVPVISMPMLACMFACYAGLPGVKELLHKRLFPLHHARVKAERDLRAEWVMGTQYVYQFYKMHPVSGQR